MKVKTPRGVWALRAATIAISLVVILAVGAVFYSAYQDFTVIRSELGSTGGTQAALTQHGTSATLSINVTIPNNGLLPLDVTLACSTSNPNYVCNAGQVSVQPGQQQVLRFRMTIVNVQQYLSSSDRRINGSVTASLAPFASIAVAVDLSSLVHTGGP